MLDHNIQNKHNTRLIQEIFQNKKENKYVGGGVNSKSIQNVQSKEKQ